LQLAPLRFSIITVCRNNGTTIARTIASVNAQIGISVQHIFIDGLSSDDTLDVIRKSAQANSMIVSEADLGIYDAMNKGLALATGDVIGILNGDDYYSGDSVLRRIADSFKASNSECVFGNVDFFNADNPHKVVRRYNSGSFTPRRLTMGLMPAHPATFFRRAVYEKCGKFKIDYKIAADFEFLVRVFGVHKTQFIYLPEVLVRMQAGGASTRGIKSKWVLNREILRALRENGLTANPLLLAAKIPFRLLELVR